MSHFYRQNVFEIIFFRIIRSCQEFIFISEFYRGMIRYARRNGEHNFFYVFRVMSHIFWNLRTRTDKTHFPFQDIDQLWQFIEFVFSQESSTFGDPRILSDRYLSSFLFGIHCHRTKFEYPKWDFIFSHTELPKEYRPWRIPFDPKGHDNGERKKDKQAWNNTSQIK